MKLKLSIITVVFNGESTIADTIESVMHQTYPDVEHIIVDGQSTDGTVKVIQQYETRIGKWISGPDQGIYDAMNKGIAIASGEIIGFLNADDIYANHTVIEQVASTFEDNDFDACYGDLVYVDPCDPDTIVRYYECSEFTPDKIADGWMPAHPALFVRRQVFEAYGGFKIDYKIAGDFEFVARVFGRHRIRAIHLPVVLVKMRTGGVSTRNWKSNVLLNKEIIRACKDNGINTSTFKVYMKYPRKLLELIRRPE